VTKVSPDVVEPIFNAIRNLDSCAKFTSYYKYNFNYLIQTDSGSIQLSYGGGDSQNIYREEFKPTREIDQFLTEFDKYGEWPWLIVIDRATGQVYTQYGSEFKVEQVEVK